MPLLKAPSQLVGLWPVGDLRADQCHACFWQQTVIDKLNAAVNATLAVSAIKERLSELGAIALPISPAEFQTFIAQEMERYAGVIRSAGISLNR